MVGARASVLLCAFVQICLAMHPDNDQAGIGSPYVRYGKHLDADQANDQVDYHSMDSPNVHQVFERSPVRRPRVTLTETVYKTHHVHERVTVRASSIEDSEARDTDVSVPTPDSIATNVLARRATTSSSRSSSSTIKISSSTKQSSSSKSSSSTVKISSSTKQSSSSKLLTSTSRQSSSTKASTTSFQTPVIRVATTTTATSIVAPIAGNVTIHGAATTSADMRYVPSQKSPSLPALKPLETSTPGPNSNLSLNYPIDTGTGSLTIAAAQSLRTLKWNPLLSRDGGKGGVINGVRFFIFADTNIASPANGTTQGTFEGFVSNSVAIDVGLNAVNSKPLLLQDGVGEWSNNVGTMRNWIPLTTGEQKYNQLYQAKGQRYGMWPVTSVTPVDNNTSVMWAPIVYTNANYTSGTVTFPYGGSTQMLVTIPNLSVGGPVASRPNPLMWSKNDVQWGCVGGIRSWGPSGVGGLDGKVYVFGAVTSGMLLARVNASSVTDKSQFEYYQGGGKWSSTSIPSTKSTAYFTKGSFSTVDIFYSAKYKTFIMVYMNQYTDSTFYWRYLKAPKPLVPGYLGGNATDFDQAIYTYSWSADYTLFKSPPPSRSYNYAGGVHQGYYGDDDITQGGSRMLLTWTHPTGKAAQSATTGYQVISAEINWS